MTLRDGRGIRVGAEGAELRLALQTPADLVATRRLLAVPPPAPNVTQTATADGRVLLQYTATVVRLQYWKLSQ